jgi:hypothetical protein
MISAVAKDQLEKAGAGLDSDGELIVGESGLGFWEFRIEPCRRFGTELISYQSSNAKIGRNLFKRRKNTVLAVRLQ